MTRQPGSNLNRGQFFRNVKLVLTSAVAMVVLASCSGAPPDYSVSARSGASKSDRREIVEFAATFVGTPYRTGGSSRKGMDCSGLVLAVFREFSVRLPRTSLDQSRVGKPVTRSKIRPADLVFFRTSGGNVSHVGIYIGDGKFLHASTSARRVRIDALGSDYFRRRYVTARRVIDT